MSKLWNSGPVKHWIFPLTAALGLCAEVAFADAPVIEQIQARQSGTTWQFNVTLSHPDTGWDHYADGWRIEDGQGNVLGFRELLHPHVNEQPFTRSLSGVVIPDNLNEVQVRARDNVDGWTKKTQSFSLSR